MRPAGRPSVSPVRFLACARGCLTNDKERQSLRQRVESVRVDGRAIRLSHRRIQVAAVNAVDVVLAGQRRDSPDGACCLARHLSRLLVTFFVLFVLKHDYAKSNNAGGDCERDTRCSDGGDLWPVRQTDDDSDDYREAPEP